jgi:hypothetical protein
VRVVDDLQRRRFRPRDFGRYLERKGTGPATPDAEPVRREVENARWYGGRGKMVLFFGTNSAI